MTLSSYQLMESIYQQRSEDFHNEKISYTFFLLYKTRYVRFERLSLKCYVSEATYIMRVSGFKLLLSSFSFLSLFIIASGYARL
jgi:hypothetical protein